MLADRQAARLTNGWAERWAPSIYKLEMLIVTALWLKL